MPMSKGYRSHGCCGREGSPGKPPAAKKINFNRTAKHGGLLAMGRSMSEHRGGKK